MWTYTVLTLLGEFSTLLFALGMRNDSVTLLPVNPTEQIFGLEIDIHGNWIIIGNYNTSSIYLYKYDGDNWYGRVKFSKDKDAQCGRSVAIRDDVAAYYCTTCAEQLPDEGCVYVIRYNRTSWVEEAKLLSPNRGSYRYFGSSVQISEGYIFVGMNSDIVVGGVYIFKYNGTDWLLETNITGVGITASSRFGHPLAFDGDYLIVGACQCEVLNTCLIYIYKHDTSASYEPTVLDITNTSSLGNIVFSVDISGDRIVIGYVQNSTNTDDGGSIHVYKRNGHSWNREAELVVSDMEYKVNRGSSVSISGGYIIVGVDGDNDVDHNPSAAYLFKYIGGTWVEMWKFLPPDTDITFGGDGNKFGVRVAMHNDKVVLGSRYNAYVFDIQLAPTTSSLSSTVQLSTSAPSPATPFSIKCNEANVTGYWRKEAFLGSYFKVSLLDSTCNTFTSNKTTIWTTASFDTCGSIIEQEDDVIIQRNEASIQITNYINDIVKRVEFYRYNMICVFPRFKNVSIHHHYNVSQIGRGRRSDLPWAAGLEASLTLYQSPSFVTESTYPVEVTINEPIYVGIHQMSGFMDLKFVVDKCFAISTDNIHDDAYIFFHERCPLDPTFKLIESSPETFKFVINTFTYIKLSKSVHIHCHLVICDHDSTSADCEQSCNEEMMLSTEEKGESVKGIANVTSGRIGYVTKKTCNDITCVQNSKCFEVFPAVCRCDDGYVLSRTQRICTRDRVVALQQLRMDEPWIDSYADESSIDSIRFAEETENKLYDMFHSLHMTDVEGVGTRNVGNGRVIIDVSVIYSKNSSKETIYERFEKAMGPTRPIEASNALEKANVIVDMSVVVDDVSNVHRRNDVLIVAVAVPIVAFSVIFPLAIVAVHHQLKLYRGDVTLEIQNKV